MVLLWMILLEVLLCAEAENVTEVRGQLGSEVTLTCSSGPSDIYWHMEIYRQLSAYIGRSFSHAQSVYTAPDFETKFSIVGNKLVIRSLRAEDCRLYLCGIKRNSVVQFVDTFHLVSEVSPSAESQQESSSTHLLLIIIIYRSAFIITALVLLILVVVFTSLWLKKKRPGGRPSSPDQ